MSIFDIFKRKTREITEKKEPISKETPEQKAEVKPNYEFTEADRRLALEIRRAEAARRERMEELKLRKAELMAKKQEIALREEIEDMESEINGYDDDEEEEEPEESRDPVELALLGLAQGFLKNKMPQAVEYTPPQEQTAQGVNITEEDVLSFIEQYPKQAEIAQKMPDELLKKSILGYMPGLTPQSIRLAIDTLKKTQIKAVKHGKK